MINVYRQRFLVFCFITCQALYGSEQSIGRYQDLGLPALAGYLDRLEDLLASCRQCRWPSDEGDMPNIFFPRFGEVAMRANSNMLLRELLCDVDIGLVRDTVFYVDNKEHAFPLLSVIMSILGNRQHYDNKGIMRIYTDQDREREFYWEFEFADQRSRGLRVIGRQFTNPLSVAVFLANSYQK